VLPKALVVSGLELTSWATQRALVEVFTERRVVLESGRDSKNEKADVTGKKSSKDDREFVEDGVWNLPDGFIMVYVCSLDPRERPKIHKSLVSIYASSSPVLQVINISVFNSSTSLR
jgi:hypothetical protein